MNAPLNPVLQGPVSGANGVPAMARTLLSLPSVPTQPGVPGVPAAVFADGLAQLLLSAVLPADAAAAALTAAKPSKLPATDADEGALTDAVAALWIELGIVVPPAIARSPAYPQIGTTPNAGTSAAMNATAPVSIPVAAAKAYPVSVDALARIETQAAANDAMPLDTPAPVSAPAAVPLFALPEPARTVAPPPAVIDLRLPQASQQIAETVVWNVGKGLNEVQIRVNPEDLGPLEVHLKLDGDKVAVRFDAADASVRDVVQTSLPQLATLLSARGLQLDQAQVFQQDRGQPQAQPTPHAEGQSERESEDDDLRPAPRIARRRGLFDDWV